MRFCAFFVFSLQKRVYNIQKQVKYRYTGWQHHRMAVLAELPSCDAKQKCKAISQTVDSTPFCALPRKQILSAYEKFVAYLGRKFRLSASKTQMSESFVLTMCQTLCDHIFNPSPRHLMRSGWYGEGGRYQQGVWREKWGICW